MKVCKVKPHPNTCHVCIDMQNTYNQFESCSECIHTNEEYELISVGTSLKGGDWAMVLKGGKIEKVALNRVYDVKEKKHETEN